MGPIGPPGPLGKDGLQGPKVSHLKFFIYFSILVFLFCLLGWLQCLAAVAVFDIIFHFIRD